jgi:JmjC domain, hydroxylase
VRWTFFPLHQEDGLLLSSNILIAGAPKIWIVFNPIQLEAVQNSFSHLLDPCAIQHKQLFIHPRKLVQHNIGFTVVVQKPLDLVITSPRSAHMGWNDDCNLASAVNFFDALWMDDDAILAKTPCPHEISKNKTQMDIEGDITGDETQVDVQDSGMSRLYTALKRVSTLGTYFRYRKHIKYNLGHFEQGSQSS